MIKRLLALLVVMVLASAVLVLGNDNSEAQTPNINLTLTISPKEGPVGTTIRTSVPPQQAQDVCLNTAEATAQLQGFATQSVTALDPGALLANPTGILGSAGGAAGVINTLNGGVLHSVAPLYVLVFTDIATRETITQKVPGWDPVTGTGSITAPNAKKPALYAVAAVCLSLKAPSTDAVTAALAGASSPDAAMAALLKASINDNPLGTGFGIFCLADPGTSCGSTAAVQAQPRTAG